MKSKRELLVLEVLLGISCLVVVCLGKHTILSSVLPVRILCLVYILAAISAMAGIIVSISKNSGSGERIEQSDYEDIADRLRSLGRAKGMAIYTDTMIIQMEKLDSRISMIKNMLAENFQGDNHSQNIEEIIDRYHRIFYENISKAIKRLSIIDARLGQTLAVDEHLRNEEKQIYREHEEYIKGKANANEKINLELDRLLAELSRINDSDAENNLEPLEDYINALKSLNSGEGEMEQLMKKY